MGEILFGTAGVSESFAAKGYKKPTDIPAYLAGFELGAFEYQCGRGVRTGQEAATALKNAAGGEVTFSLHAPYYISMASEKEETRLGSINYFLQSAQLVKWLGGNRVIFHPGACGKGPREAAVALAKTTMQTVLKALKDEGHDDIILCPEVMGKINQLGTLEEVLDLCLLHESITPCIDFGHLNARTGGGLASKAAFAAALNMVKNKLGEYRAKNFHVHFSKIEYTAGGEKRHLTFEDNKYGPDFEPFIELCSERGLTPVVICESDGTQAEDAATMQAYYKKLHKV